jgi:hypothetical protein
MSKYEDFQPANEEERQWVENYNNLSKYISDKLKGINKKDRLTALKAANPSDLSLMNLFLFSLRNEDYEICEVAKILLHERGLKFQSEK